MMKFDSPRVTTEGCGDALIAASLDGTVLSWDSGAEITFGYPCAEAVGRGLVELIVPPDRVPDELELERSALANGEASRGSIRRTRDGCLLNLSLLAQVVRDPGNGTESFLFTARDLTRVAALRESERIGARYGAVLDSTPDAMVMVNADGRMVLVNCHAEAVFGYPRAELLGRAVEALLPERFRAAHVGHRRRYFAEPQARPLGGRPDHPPGGPLELFGLRKNGEEFPVEISLGTLATDEGVLAISAIRDITAHRKGEQKFRDLLESAPDAMVLVSRSGRIELVNSQTEKLFGYARAELLGQPVDVLIPERFRKDNPGSPFADPNRRPMGAPMQFWGRRKDGSEFPAEINLSPLETEDGTVVSASIRDLSDRKRLEDQLRQSQKMEAIGRLAGSVAHDFNNVLTIIEGHVALQLAAPGLSAAVRDSAEQVLEAAQRAGTIARQLLTFSRRQVPQLRWVDLNEVVAHMLRMLRDLLGEGIRLHSELAPGLPAIHADAGMLEQVLLNLAVNARDAMPAGGQFSLRTAAVDRPGGALHLPPEAAPGAYVTLTATDTGSGISSEHLPHIFEPFFTTKEAGKGTGLGLATVYGIVRQHGGWIEVHSGPGRGTLFVVYLPAMPAPGRPVAAAPEPPRVRGGTETILLAEDEPTLRELVRNILQSHGYRVLEAACAKAALKLWRQHAGQVDLLLTDLVLGEGVSGRELAEHLRQKQPELKVIFSSGYSPEAAGRDFALLPGLNFLQKPYSPALLLGRLRECLDQRPGN